MELSKKIGQYKKNTANYEEKIKQTLKDIINKTDENTSDLGRG